VDFKVRGRRLLTTGYKRVKASC